MKTYRKSALTRRDLKIKLKSAKRRKLSSSRWLVRQLNDPFVQEAKARGYRSRSAFKIIELDNKFKFLSPGASVVDLGCAPGGWSQIAVNRTNASGRENNDRQGSVVGIDLRPVAPIDGAIFEVLNFLEDGAEEKIKSLLNGRVDVVMSDMAPSSTGHKQTDHLRICLLYTSPSPRDS